MDTTKLLENARTRPTTEYVREHFVCRPMRTEDIDQIEIMNEAYDFEYGRENIRLIFETSPDTWDVVVHRTTGEVACYVGGVRMSNGSIMAFKIGCLQKYASLALNRMFTDRVDYMANFRPMAILFFSRKLPFYQHKQLCFTGVPDLSAIDSLRHAPSVEVHEVDESNVDAVCRFETDNIIPDVDRTSFIREWCTATRFKTLVHSVCAYQNGKMTGFGALRSGWRNGNGWFLSPVYALNDESAEAIVKNLVGLVKPGQEVNFVALANQRTMLHVAKALKLPLSVPLYHMHLPGSKAADYLKRIRYECVYCTITCWPV